MRLPHDWDAEKASGWWELHHLIHTNCGWRSSMAYDVICDEATVRQIVYRHECNND